MSVYFEEKDYFLIARCDLPSIDVGQRARLQGGADRGGR
jgi:hypothetical protein